MDTTSLKKRFGCHVRRLRDAIAPKVSQEAFADEAKLDRSHYGRVERGETAPNLVTIARIARRHGLALSELFAYDQPKRKLP